MAGARICLGQIGAAHGVGGEVRLRSFTAEPTAIADYGPLQTDDGRVLRIEALRPAKDHFIARLSGVGDRDSASALANAKLYVPRERLPEPQAPDEFYHADLIGLAAVLDDGTALGRVRAIYDFGGGDTLEIERPAAPPALVPFTRAIVPIVDLEAGRLVIDPPPGLLDRPRADPA